MKGLVIDNYDSFSYNLVEYLGESAANKDIELSQDVFYNDEISCEEVENRDYDFIVISPGPGHPENKKDVGITNEILETVSQDTPTLGVCLGLEAAIYSYGGNIDKAPEPVHGKSFDIYHDGQGVFKDLENPYQGARYHSLVADEIPESFDISATTSHRDQDLVMGVRHEEYPIEAVQFHPESILSGEGDQNRYKLIENFLEDLS